MFRASFILTVAVVAFLLAGCGDGPVSVGTGQNEILVSPDTPGSSGCPWNCEHLWFCSNSTISYSRPDWMGQLSDNLYLSELSLPGSHDTMSRFGGPLVYCQSLTLDKQLNAGIRAFDIRLRHIEDVFAIHHGVTFQNAFFGSDVLDVFRDFLISHPAETIIMLAAKTHSEEKVTRTFGETFKWYMLGRQHMVWQGDPVTGFSSPPRLGDVRGKIVIIQDFSAVDSQGVPMMPFGFPWNSLVIQNNYKMAWTHASFNRKWGDIRTHINLSMLDPYPLSWYINFTSGAAGSWLTTLFPVSVAHGSFIPFEYCDGMNQRTYKYITNCYKTHCAPYLLENDEHGRLGIIMSDYPGGGLIDAIIAHNGLPSLIENNPPVAVAGGPYVADEGSVILFDASGSTDYENDPLQYRWDVDGDDVFDTAWSSDPTATHTWFDDYIGTAQVEVSDGDPARADKDMTTVTVANVQPEVTIEAISNVVPGFVLPGQTVEIHGSFTDVGYIDTHEALWRFGDQTTLAGSLVETNNPPEAQGTVVDEHMYSAPGYYLVRLEVLDDDGGLGVGTMDLTVMSATEALHFIDNYIQGLSDSAFHGPADNRKATLSNKLATVMRMVTSGNRKSVLSKLRHDIRTKFDGYVDGNPQNDWIIDASSQQELCFMLDGLIEYIEGPLWKVD